MGRPRLELKEGQRFGQLTVLRFSRVIGHVYWMCKCDCGVEKEIAAGSLSSGNTQSCGCSKFGNVNAATTEHSQRPEYKSWWHMHDRCENKNNHKYSTYGAVGITVCERWKDFYNFLADMGPKPTIAHSIDRLDNTKGYYKENCRWATTAEQNANRRDYIERPSRTSYRITHKQS